MNASRFEFTLVAALLACLALPASAPAQTAGNLDHLVCYRMKDKTQISSTLDLRAELQPEFTQAGCEIIKPIEFCVPATKLNVSPPPPLPGIKGQALQNDYICYLIKCPKPVAPSRLVADQFGRRLQEKYKPFKVCVPARKAAKPCGQIGTSARKCGGACDDPTETCRFDTATRSCTCDPVPTCDGKPDAAGQCGGTCPVVGEVCRPGLDGTRPICDCQPPFDPPCDMNASSGACGGVCPNPTDQCVTNATGSDCFCQPVEQGCAAVVGGSCAGTCTAPGFNCAIDPLTNDCRCMPPQLPCGPNPATGQCGGACPAPELCRAFTAGTTITCQCQ